MLAETQLWQGRPEAARSILDQVRLLTASMTAYYYQPELLRIEAEWLRLAGRQTDARTLFMESVDIARQQGSWALAIRAALGLARAASIPSDADLDLLHQLYRRLPVDNDTDYGRDAEVLLGASAL